MVAVQRLILRIYSCAYILCASEQVSQRPSVHVLCVLCVFIISFIFKKFNPKIHKALYGQQCMVVFVFACLLLVQLRCLVYQLHRRVCVCLTLSPPEHTLAAAESHTPHTCVARARTSHGMPSFRIPQYLHCFVLSAPVNGILRKIYIF